MKNHAIKISGGDYLILFYRLLAIMLVYTLCRFIFWAYNSDLIPNSSPWESSRLYLGGLRFDLSAVLLTNSVFILLSIAPTPWRYHHWWKRASFASYIIPNSIAILLNGFDFEFYKFTLRRSTATLFATFENEQNKSTLITRIMVDYWDMVLLIILMTGFLVWFYRRTEVIRPAQFKLRFYATNTILLLTITGLAVAGIRGGFDRTTRPITLSNAGEYTTDPDQIPIVLNTPFSILRTWNKKAVTRKHYFDETTLATIYTPQKTPTTSQSFQNENVVIFIMESWGKEASGALNPELDDGTYQGFTPFFDSLIENGLSFKYSFANGKKSIDGMPSVVASIPSLLVPYFLSHESSNRINSIASLLKTKGYHSAFFHGAPNGSMGFQAFANMAGYDEYYGKTEYGNDDHLDGYWGIWDHHFFQFFAQTMNTFSEPFVTTIFSVSSHHPYVVPESYEGKLRTGQYPIYRSINYTDTALKEFFETARDMPWFKNTLFVFTADHTFSKTAHSEYLNKTGRFEIPILFYKPDGSLKKHDESRVIQQIDIMPSILGYLRYDRPYIAFGTDYFNDAPSSNFAINYHNNYYQWFSEQYTLIASDDGVYGLFDRTDDRDFKRDISRQYPGRTAEMERRLKAFIQQYSNRMLDNKLTIEE